MTASLKVISSDLIEMRTNAKPALTVATLAVKVSHLAHCRHSARQHAVLAADEDAIDVEHKSCQFSI